MKRTAEIPIGVQVGKVVELTRDDAKELSERAYQLQVLVKHQKPGWFAAYVMTVNQINRCIRNAISRSHGLAEGRTSSADR